MQISDPQALRAMAHPLRLDLIELLGMLGSATAAECARHLSGSQASCSYHLRILEKYGFVEHAGAGEDSRERPWRLCDIKQNWSASNDSPAAGELDRVFIQREAERILDWQDSAAEQPRAWRHSSFRSGMTVPMTPAELSEVQGQLYGVMKPYIERLERSPGRSAEQRFVRVLLAGTPVLSNTEEGGV